MSQKRIEVRISEDSSGETVTKYACEGFEGDSCEIVAMAMATTGLVEEKKTTDDAYAHHIPIPVPNQARS